MYYRTLGRTGLKVSAVGLGAWQIGGAVDLTFDRLGTIAHGWGKTDDRQSINLLARCGDAGVNFIDTAPIYGDGHSETVIGRALGKQRDQWVLCTKGGHGATRGTAWNDFSRDRLLRQMDESLTRLRTDYVDIYLLHGPGQDDIKAGACLDALDTIKRQGKARFTGVSLGPNEMGIDLIREQRVDVLQQAVSVLNRQAADTLLPMASQHKVGVIARGVFGAGFLTGALSLDAEFPPDDRRNWSGGKARQDLAPSIQVLRDLAGKDRTPAQLALQYVLQLPGVSTAIVGTRRWSHMEENIGALDGPALTDEQLRRVTAL